jgi:hypothetical protein
MKIIRSRYILELIEDYEKFGNVCGDKVAIYKNPDISDILDMKKTSKSETNRELESMRWVFFRDNKNIYVADSTRIFFHDNLMKALGFKKKDYVKTLSGVATIQKTGKPLVKTISCTNPPPTKEEIDKIKVCFDISKHSIYLW